MENTKKRDSSKFLLAVLSSPRRKSNSSAIAERILEGFRAAAGEGSERRAESVSLREIGIGPCLACDECKREPGAPCIQDDDMQRLYPSVKEADTLLLASPVYSFNLSAQIKIFIDRLYALWNPDGSDHLEGKRLLLVLTYGDDDVFVSGAVNAIRSMQDLCRFYGMELMDVIHCSAGDEGEAERNGDLMERARGTGLLLSGG